MSRRVLIVDDDPATRTGLIQLLRQAGYEAYGSGTFQDARQTLAEHPPDLLIADVRLGAFNGLQLLVTRQRPIPTIVITAFEDRVLEAEARQLGAHFLTKPISPSDLLTLVDQLLAAGATSESFTTPRRWFRKKVTGPLTADVDGSPARVLDVSYGGLRFEVQRPAEHGLPRSFHITLPTSHVSVPVDLVWRSRSGEETWTCGASLAEMNQASARAWFGLVDAIA